MSKKCWLIVVTLALIAIAFLIAIPIFLPLAPGITYSNYSRLESGMTHDEVEALLGKPDSALKGVSPDGDTSFLWQNANQDSIWVTFGVNGLVKSFTWNHSYDERTPFQKMMDRLPWFSKPPPAPVRK